MNKKGFTLVELIIAVGVLAVAGVFLVQMFLSASVLSQKARDTDTALYHAQAIIEEFKISPIIGDLTLFFDDDWNESEGGVYMLSARVTQESGMSRISVTVTRREPYPMSEEQVTELIGLTAEKYIGGAY